MPADVVGAAVVPDCVGVDVGLVDVPVGAAVVGGGVVGTSATRPPVNDSDDWLHEHTSCEGVVAADLVQPLSVHTWLVVSKKTHSTVSV